MGWLMGKCWRWGGWWMRMVGHSQWPCDGIRICYNSMYGWKSKIDQAQGVTGLCKMEQRLTQPTLTSTFSMTNFKKELIAVRTQMAALQSGSEPSFQSFVWVFVKYKICCIKHELIPELQRAVEDVSVTIPTDMLRDAIQNLRKRAQAFLKVSGGYLKYFVRPI